MIHESLRARVLHHFEMLPIIQARALELRVGDLKPQRMHQMQRHAGRQTKASDGPRVLRDLGLNQNYVQIMRHTRVIRDAKC